MLRFSNKTLTLSRRALATIEAMRLQNSFKPAELPKDLSEEATLALVRRLYREGFLILAK